LQHDRDAFPVIVIVMMMMMMCSDHSELQLATSPPGEHQLQACMWVVGQKKLLLV
jgi:hypothetical protein